jgi:hypothetical protein
VVVLYQCISGHCVVTVHKTEKVSEIAAVIIIIIIIIKLLAGGMKKTWPRIELGLTKPKPIIIPDYNLMKVTGCCRCTSDRHHMQILLMNIHDKKQKFYTVYTLFLE